MQDVKKNYERLVRRLRRIPWKKKPFRGLQRELARSLGITPQQLTKQLYERKDTDTIDALIALMDGRNIRIQAARERLDSAIKGMSDAQKI